MMAEISMIVESRSGYEIMVHLNWWWFMMKIVSDMAKNGKWCLVTVDSHVKQH